MDSIQGKLLVASPHLPDDNFYRSVVLMVTHNEEEGAFGLILNRPTENTIADFWELISSDPCECFETINLGGPVPSPLLAIHCDESHAEAEVIPNVFMTTNKDVVEHLVKTRDHRFRLFTGYAGWSPGNWKAKLERGGWLTTDASFEDIFAEDDELWERVSQSIGLQIMTPLIGSQDVPDDPSVN